MKTNITKSQKYKNKHYVYLHIDPRTCQVVYIGKGTRLRAWHIHNRSDKHVKWFDELKSLNIIPIIKIIHVFDIPEPAFIREQMLIAFLRRSHVKLFNRAPGGLWIPSGAKHPRTGTRLSSSIGKKVSETRKRRKIKPWNKGLKTGPNPLVSELQKVRMKGNTIRKGQKMPQSAKNAISKALIGNQYRSVKILCENNGKEYASVKEAWTDLGLDERSIFRVLKGEWKHTKGYKFRYL